MAVPIRESIPQNDQHAKYYGVIQEVCAELARIVERATAEGGFPIVLGGDHSIAMGTLKGLRDARGRPAGLVWIDAHSDINTPQTSSSGNVHGMPLWFALKHGYAEGARTVQIGLRDVDRGEKQILRDAGVTAFSMSDIDKLGMTAVMERTIAITGAGENSVHVSFDMDGIDPSEAPGTGTPVKGGLSYREAHLAMEILAESGVLGSIEMVEINPILDQRNQTAILAVGLILSGLGKSIL
ncbi:MAG: arginase [Candidatus Eremiobacteraeota bacterium]|nr:arginase [Candidatus Eremiobacteraeota bacterium]